jgi:PRC-barrel domain
MAAFDPATLDRWRALAIVDRDGGTVGTISEFYLDRETGYPTWALVNTGLFGTTQTFVPLVHATEISDGLQVPYEKRHIKDSPRVDLHDELSPDEEATLLAHYGVEYELHPEADAGAGPVVDTENEPGEPPGAVPAGAGLTGSPVATPEPAPGPGEPPGPVPADPGPAGGGRSRVEHPEGTATSEGGAIPEGTGISESTGTPDDTGNPERPGDPDLDRTSADGPGPDSSQAEPADPDLDRTSDGPGPDSSQAEPADPDLSRTAPVAHGLPGSTAASPFGFGPPTIDKGAAPSELPAEEPSRPPAEAGWAPDAAGSFEEQEPVSRPASASDHWREAKAAAERERIARAAAQPEERSPLERARRRLERLVGGGQDHPDPEDISPAERDAAERARRARLGLDEEDHRRKR